MKSTTNGRMTKHSCAIGDASDDDSIVKVWKDHYEKLYCQHSNDNIVDVTAKCALQLRL